MIYLHDGARTWFIMLTIARFGQSNSIESCHSGKYVNMAFDWLTAIQNVVLKLAVFCYEFHDKCNVSNFIKLSLGVQHEEYVVLIT